MNTEVALKEIKRVAHQVLPPGGKVFLFGSRARNEGHSDSDWDILILLEKEKIQNADFDTVAYPLVELGWSLGEMIHPILYTFKEWKRRSFTPFYKNVEKESIEL